MHRRTAYQLRSNDVGVIHEDARLLVLNKPAGLLVIPDRYDATLPNLLSLLRMDEPDVYVVHRLDRETSGIIAFALTADAHASLNAQFEGREVRKVYIALCRGEAGSDAGTIDLPLSERGRGAARMKVDMKEGKPSTTDYRVIERFEGMTLVEARPRTGRTHQIRVHLAESGLPIVADPLYGDGEPFRLSSIKRSYRAGESEEKPLLARTALHASSLTFRDPSDGKERTFEAPLPKDLRSAINMARKYAPPRASNAGARAWDGPPSAGE